MGIAPEHARPRTHMIKRNAPPPRINLGGGVIILRHKLFSRAH